MFKLFVIISVFVARKKDKFLKNLFQKELTAAPLMQQQQLYNVGKFYDNSLGTYA